MNEALLDFATAMFAASLRVVVHSLKAKSTLDPAKVIMIRGWIKELTAALDGIVGKEKAPNAETTDNIG